MTTPPLITLGALSFVLASCGSLQNLSNLSRPLSGNSGFDPLRSPGSVSASSAQSSVAVAPTSPSYKAGQWVETAMPNATFFRSIPKGNARADKVLKVGTPLKVISSKGTYVKTELDSGDIGYVPEIMLIDRASVNAAPASSLTAPVPEFGAVPPPVDPGDLVPPAPVPEIPSSAPPVPTVPSVPAVPDLPSAPPVPDVASPPIPETLPTVPSGVAPPPEIPGIIEPVEVR